MCATQAFALGANSDSNLKRVTAFEAGTMSTDNITLIEVKRGLFQVTWRAQTPSGTYLCRADDMVRNVECKKLDEPASPPDGKTP
jgi:hypothetical protein